MFYLTFTIDNFVNFTTVQGYTSVFTALTFTIVKFGLLHNNMLFLPEIYNFEFDLLYSSVLFIILDGIYTCDC